MYSSIQIKIICHVNYFKFFVNLLGQNERYYQCSLNRKLKKPKRIRKTIRRTYRVGRSKVRPKISVLISNRTIRNNITTKKQLLKQIPIEEIRKYLISHGFIKVGSNSPNDVLRKMYETASMVCGEIQNHNPEHVIYNYMNEKTDS